LKRKFDRFKVNQFYDNLPETILVTFEDKRRVIDNFYRENLEILADSRRVILDIERENEKIYRAIESGYNNKYMHIRGWKFFRCTNGKLRIVQKSSNDEEIDPDMEKKRINY
jgi:hypothetical protein